MKTHKFTNLCDFTEKICKFLGNNDGDDESAAEEREEKRRIRKLRSRRDRCKNGVQFTQTLHPDFRKSERFEVKKSLSDIAMKGKHFGISSR